MQISETEIGVIIFIIGVVAYVVGTTLLRQYEDKDEKK